MTNDTEVVTMPEKVNGEVSGNPSDGPPQEMKMDFFEMYTAPPKWLTIEFFEKALQSYEKDKSLKINPEDFKIIPGTKPGDNFASIVFRTNATYTTRGQTKSKVPFIMKVEPFNEGMKRDMLKDAPLFETEILMYTKTLPEMQRLLKSIGDPEIIAPNLVYGSTDPKIIIFEDISPDNFGMIHTPIDMANLIQIAKRLGKFHGLSFYMNEDHQNIDSYKSGFGTPDVLKNFTFLEDNFNSFAEEVKLWGPKYEAVAEKMSLLKTEVIKKFNKIYVANRPGSGYNILNHGDFHIKNLLFRKSSPETVEDVRFIDFQLSIFATPAIDINYLLYVIGDTEARENHREEIVRIYYDEFVDILSKLGYLKTPPSLLDLQLELLKNGFMEVFISIGFLPMFFMDFEVIAEITKGENMSMEVMEKIRIASFRQPKYKALMEKAVIGFLHKGFLDV